MRCLEILFNNNEGQAMERSQRCDEVFPYLTVSYMQVVYEKKNEKFCRQAADIKFNYSYVGSVCALTLAPQTPPTRSRFRPQGRLQTSLVISSIHL